MLNASLSLLYDIALVSFHYVSACLYANKFYISYSSPGHSPVPESSFQTLLESLKETLLSLYYAQFYWLKSRFSMTKWRCYWLIEYKLCAYYP